MGRDIYIWCAGHGGAIVKEVLERDGISVAGFIDKKAVEIGSYKDCPCILPEKVDRKQHYVIISLIQMDYALVEYLFDQGFSSHDFCYVYQFVYKEDIVWYIYLF